MSVQLGFDVPAALGEAQAVRKEMERVGKITPDGLIRTDKLAWAMKDIRKYGELDAVMRKVGSGTYCRRRPEDDRMYRAYVAERLAAQAPIHFRVGSGPLKNVQVCGSHQYPDCAEYLMMVQLARFILAVAALYPYGIAVQIVPDDLRSRQANLCQQGYISSYIQGLQALVRDLGFNGWLRVENGQADLYAQYNVPAYQEAAAQYIKEWQQREPEAFAAKWQRAVGNASRNLAIDPQWSDAERTQQAQAAAWRYLVAHQSEILAGLWSAQEAFPLRYGRHPGFFQIYTIKEKQAVLPWQISLPFPAVQAMSAHEPVDWDKAA